MPAWVKAVAAHTASYAEPIGFKAGDGVTLSGRTDNWDGHIWLWATGPDGREGWIPDDILTGDPPVARRDFDAMELSCALGERLEALEETHGWRLCQNAEGAVGWLPARCLEPS